MKSPLVSVVIPAYNQARYLGEAIQSVLDQTYPHFEIIVVNDASPDDSADLTRSFDDPRITLLEHDVNRGLSAARNTGIRAAKGQIIALLDADDEFLPEKLAAHVAFYGANPETGATYNARYELHYSLAKIRSLYRPPDTVKLHDFVLGFPFAPSDLVLQRDWLHRVGNFDERLIYFGEDQDFYCRLALEGCPFGYVDRALNLRRHHSQRYDRHFAERMVHDREVIASVLDDPRCPTAVRELRDQALANHLIVRVFHAFAQSRTEQGRDLLLEAVRRNPALLDGNPNRLEAWLAFSAAVDVNLDHDALLKSFREQMPAHLAWSEDRHERLVATGYMQRAVLAALWDYDADAAQWLKAAVAYNLTIDQSLLDWIAHLLFDIDQELGAVVADDRLSKLSSLLEQLDEGSAVRKLKAQCLLNRAFAASHHKVPAATRYLIEAIRNNPRYLRNRGVLSHLYRAGISAIRLTSIQ